MKILVQVQDASLEVMARESPEAPETRAVTVALGSHFNQRARDPVVEDVIHCGCRTGKSR